MLIVGSALTACLASLSAQVPLPNEFVVTPGAAMAPPEALSAFVSAVDLAFVGRLMTRQPQMWNDGKQIHLVTELTFEVTKAFKAVVVGESVVTIMDGGSYLLMPDQTMVPRAVSEFAQPLVVDAQYFVAASNFNGRPRIAWIDTTVKVDNDAVSLPLGSTAWMDATIVTGRAEILNGNAAANPSSRDSFLRALNTAFGVQP
jgi:hypothetical protein